LISGAFDTDRKRENKKFYKIALGGKNNICYTKPSAVFALKTAKSVFTKLKMNIKTEVKK